MRSMTRRDLIGCSGKFAGTALLEAARAAAGSEPQTEQQVRKLKVVVVGAHPDDPEQSCGGTIARFTDLGHEVTVIYLTRGEAGIRGKTEEEAAAIRTAEAEKACQILKARPVFAGQIDGRTEVNRARYAEFRKIIEAENPDLVLTHWPIDSHPDHRVASLLTYDAWLRGSKKFALYFSQVDVGGETQNFIPTNYVDITATEARKREAIFAHASQTPAHWYDTYGPIFGCHGLEFGTRYAEAFNRHVQNRSDPLAAVL